MQALLLPARAAPPAGMLGQRAFSASQLRLPILGSSGRLSRRGRESTRRHITVAAASSSSAGPLNPTPPPSQQEIDQAKLEQVVRRLDKTARYFKNLGTLGFWSQLVSTVVSAGILSFSTVVTGKVTAPFTFYATAAGIAAAFVSVFWSFGYIRTTLQRVTRPSGGINEWLHFLPIFLHRFIDKVLRHFFRNTRFAPVVQGRKPYRVSNSGLVGLSSVLEADVKKIVTVAHDTYEKEGPTLVVACGWDTISYSSLIRKLASDNVFVIQIQHPRSCLGRFDLVVTPRHDFHALTASGRQEVPRLFRRWITPQEPPGRNVILTVGALHQADSAALRLAAIAWHDELAPLPKPLLIVNIGGPTGNCKYSVDLARQLITSLYNVLDSCGSVRISFTGRTPQKVADVIFKEFNGHPKIYIWDGEEPNPHMGHLAWADAFIITADSVSMLSEACSTGKPVYVIGTEHCKWKLSTFHKTLQEHGVVRPFTGLEDISNSWSYSPLNDAIEVATHVREVIAERGWTVG